MPAPMEFLGGDDGPWKVLSISRIKGAGLPGVKRLALMPAVSPRAKCVWALSAYLEGEALLPESSPFALLVAKQFSSQWWELSDAQREQIAADGESARKKALAATAGVSYRAFSSRELTKEPFHQIEWWEYSVANEFDELQRYLRSASEPLYLSRHVEIHLSAR